MLLESQPDKPELTQYILESPSAANLSHWRMHPRVHAVGQDVSVRGRLVSLSRKSARVKPESGGKPVNIRLANTTFTILPTALQLKAGFVTWPVNDGRRRPQELAVCLRCQAVLGQVGALDARFFCEHARQAHAAATRKPLTPWARHSVIGENGSGWPQVVLDQATYTILRKGSDEQPHYGLWAGKRYGAESAMILSCPTHEQALLAAHVLHDADGDRNALTTPLGEPAGLQAATLLVELTIRANPALWSDSESAWQVELHNGNTGRLLDFNGSLTRDLPEQLLRLHTTYNVGLLTATLRLNAR